MIGSFSIIADQSISRAAAAASIRVRRSSPNFVLQRFQVALQPRALPAGLSISFSSSSRSFASAARSLPISISSSRRKRPQPHVEDRLGLAVREREFRHHHRLGLVLGADDLDHAVEVEIGDQEAVEQLEAVVDLADPHLAPADEHLELEGEPRGERLLEAHHARRARRIEHVEVEREADFEIRQAIQALEQQLGIDGPRPRLEDQPDLLVAFVLHVGEDRQLLVGDELGDLLDQLGLGTP